MPAVSVIVPVYNAGRHLPRCVQSIQSQTMRDLEIILVDDGSTDGSAQLCEELASADDRIRVFHKKNGGVSSARNFGIEKAKGEYLLFVDADDLSIPICSRFSSMARNRLALVLRHVRTCVCAKKRVSMLLRKMQKTPSRRFHARASRPLALRF